MSNDNSGENRNHGEHTGCEGEPQPREKKKPQGQPELLVEPTRQPFCIAGRDSSLLRGCGNCHPPGRHLNGAGLLWVTHPGVGAALIGTGHRDLLRNRPRNSIGNNRTGPALQNTYPAKRRILKDLSLRQPKLCQVDTARCHRYVYPVPVQVVPWSHIPDQLELILAGLFCRKLERLARRKKMGRLQVAHAEPAETNNDQNGPDLSRNGNSCTGRPHCFFMHQSQLPE